MTTFRIVGPGRAGRSLSSALVATGDFHLRGMLGRDDPSRGAAAGVDILVIATPDHEVARVAATVAPVPTTVVLHLSGSLGLSVLDGHRRRASLHPLVPLPSAEIGAERLRSGVTFAVAGDGMARRVAAALGGTALTVDDRDRVTYHAAASIAANHLVALLGQVGRVAAAAGLPLEAFRRLVDAATEDAFAVGPSQALTGPAARGDWETVAAHRQALGALPGHRTELAAYDALVGLARRLSMAEAPPVVATQAALASPTTATPLAAPSPVEEAERALAGLELAGVEWPSGVELAGTSVREHVA